MNVGEYKCCPLNVFVLVCIYLHDVYMCVVVPVFLCGYKCVCEYVCMSVN